MTSHDNRDNILSDQKLHDLLKAEAEIERLVESKRDPRMGVETPPVEGVEESLL